RPGPVPRRVRAGREQGGGPRGRRSVPHGLARPSPIRPCAPAVRAGAPTRGANHDGTARQGRPRGRQRSCQGDSSMSHHYSGPRFGFPGGDARWDVCDLFAFPKPGDAGKSILITDVHPSVGFNPPGPTPSEPFDPKTIYEIRVDTNGDLVADIAFRVRFSPGS